MDTSPLSASRAHRGVSHLNVPPARSRAGDHRRIAALCEQIQGLTQEISAMEEQFAAAVGELRRLTEDMTTWPRASRPPTEAHVRGFSRASSQARGTRGELISRIQVFLATNRNLSFKASAVAEALDVPHRKKAVYMNLLRLSQRGQIRKTELGFAALAEYPAARSLRLG